LLDANSYAQQPTLSRVKGVKRNTFSKLSINLAKDLQIFSGGAKKGDWDVGIAVDAIKMSQRIDALILVAGDGDFVPLIEYLQNISGIQVEVVSFGKSTSMKLKEVADDFLDLSENPQKYLIGGR
jgi:uncharacterized LabA/DUF88 family protein